MKKHPVLITLFGATGDLASRKLYPALFKLYQKGFLAENFAVIGTARRPWTDDYFHSIIESSINSLAINPDEAKKFASHFYYLSHNVNDTNHYITLKELSEKLDAQYNLHGNRIFYLAVAPQFFGTIAEHLKTEDVLSTAGYNHLIIEKPFGHDYHSAKELNTALRTAFKEEQIYRIDHYLGKPMIQQLALMRKDHTALENILTNEYVNNIQITLAEKVSVEDRGGYYETSGALRDMLQNHILQVLALIAMDTPVNGNIRQAKMNVLNQLPNYHSDEVREYFVRGQYGEDASHTHPSYRSNQSVADDSIVETYVAGKILLTNNRWKNTPFYVRTGKSMTRKYTSIVIQFKKLPNSQIPNTIKFMIDPDENVQIESFEDTNPLYQTILNTYFNPKELHTGPEDYEKLILDCMNHESNSFSAWEEVAASWQFVDLIRQAWNNEPKPLFPNYEAGSMGPIESQALLEKDGNDWII